MLHIPRSCVTTSQDSALRDVALKFRKANLDTGLPPMTCLFLQVKPFLKTKVAFAYCWCFHTDTLPTHDRSCGKSELVGVCCFPIELDVVDIVAVVVVVVVFATNVVPCYSWARSVTLKSNELSLSVGTFLLDPTGGQCCRVFLLLFKRRTQRCVQYRSISLISSEKLSIIRYLTRLRSLSVARPHNEEMLLSWPFRILVQVLRPQEM